MASTLSAIASSFGVSQTLRSLVLLAISIGIVNPAISEVPYPNKPVRIIAPVAPGGGVDLVARTIADRLTKAFGQSFIVDNQSGGGGAIAGQATVRSPADGYTLMLGYVGTHGTNPAVRKLPYDAIKDFTPIAMVGGTPNVFIVYPGVPAKNLKEYIQYAVSHPGKTSYGSSGQGTLTHLAMEQLKLQANFFSVHVPYRGIGPAFTDLIGGFEGFDGVQWYGIVGPANLPEPIVKKLNEEINKAISAPELKERLSAEAIEPMPMTPDQFAKYIKNDIARWSKVAKERNIQLD